MFEKNKSIIIGLGAVIIIAVIYLFFFNTPDEADLTAEAAGSDAELYFVNLAEELGTISFDSTLLSDPRFAALIDIRTPIFEEAVGRRDPFASVPGLNVQK